MQNEKLHVIKSEMTKIAIAGFIILGDIETHRKKTAAALAAKAPADTEVIMTAENKKGIPLAEIHGPSYGASLLCSGQKNQIKGLYGKILW